MGTLAGYKTRQIYQFGPFCADPDKQILLRDAEIIPLTPKAFQVLLVLLRHGQQVVTKDDLMKAVWPDTFVEEANLSRNIFMLRKALGESPQDRYIVTVPGRGYRMAEDVRLIATQSGPGPLAADLTPDAEAGEADANKSTLLRVPSHPVLRADASFVPRATVWVVAGVAVLAALLMVRVVLQRSEHGSTLPRFTAFTTKRGTARKPAFSPDGTEIAFTWSGPEAPRFRIYVQALGSSTTRKLIDDPEPSHEELVPRWWPDGSRIAYIRTMPGKPDEIWTVPRTGGTPRKLLTLRQVLGFDIAPDGERVVIGESQGPPQPISIYLIRLTDMSRRALTTPPNTLSAMAGWQTGDVDPRFTPDGRDVTFVRWASTSSDIFQVSAAGGDLRRLTENHAPIDGYTLTPDGQALILATSHDESHRLALWRYWLRTRRSEQLTTLSLKSVANADPAVSPDGRRLAATQRSRPPGDLYRYDLLPTSVRAQPATLADSNACNISPAFSADGTKLAFASCRTGHMEIYVANRDGSSPVQLTAFSGNLAGSPQWSPDGSKITFDFRPDAHAHVFVIDSNGGPARQLTFGDSENMVPRFSADGAWVYFSRRKRGGADLWKVPVGGGDAVFVMADVWNFALHGNTVFYNKIFQHGIFARSLSAEAERLLVQDSGAFTVSAEGVYYFHEPPSGPFVGGVSTTVSVNGQPLTSLRGCEGHELFLYSLVTGRSTHVLEVQLPVCHGMAVSPDRKTLLVSGDEPMQSDIILSDRFN
jgi:Tol biopolymer transport system component/DNA-binding winged helix-turn-helix (wHTH) protein